MNDPKGFWRGGGGDFENAGSEQIFGTTVFQKKTGQIIKFLVFHETDLHECNKAQKKKRSVDMRKKVHFFNLLHQSFQNKQKGQLMYWMIVSVLLKCLYMLCL